MREINFRAWYKEKMQIPWEISKAGCSIPNIYIHDMKENDGVGLLYRTRSDEIFKDPAIFMQYIGLKDKNGKEIYEGDIIENQNILGEIIYIGFDRDNMYRCTFLIRSKDRDYSVMNMIDEVGLSQLEIKGNIYENPELLQPNK